MNDRWMILGTWTFAEKHVPAGSEILARGGSAVDAAVTAIRGIEADPQVDSVGLGGLPGWDGLVELDAAVMDGHSLRVGGVAGLRGFLHPIEVARDVMRLTAHSLLAGEGAMQFADRNGHARGNLLTPEALRRWAQLRAREGARPDDFDNIRQHGVQGKPVGHDTVGLVARDRAGNFCAATSTSGLALKLPGRVGDSPVCGAGLFADNRRGAAAATGVGEDILRSALCFRVVDLMGRGADAMEACEAVMRESCAALAAADREPGEMAVVALDPRGGFGYAANHGSFHCMVQGEHTPGGLRRALPCCEG